MKQLPLISRQILLLASVLMLTLVGMTACGSAGAPAAEVVAPTVIVEATPAAEPTTEPVPTEIVEPSPMPSPTSEPAPSTVGAISVHPSDLRTGLSAVDPVLDAIASGDAAQIAARFQLLETGCTTADGLGGPPKCEEGQAEGTVVSGFPVLESEGHFVTPENFQQLAESMDFTGVFGVYRVTSGPGPEEAYWPSGDYGVVLAGQDPLQTITLLVTEGNIVRVVFHYMGGPEQVFDSALGEIVIPPLQ